MRIFLIALGVVAILPIMTAILAAVAIKQAMRFMKE